MEKASPGRHDPGVTDESVEAALSRMEQAVARLTGVAAAQAEENRRLRAECDALRSRQAALEARQREARARLEAVIAELQDLLAEPEAGDGLAMAEEQSGAEPQSSEGGA